MVTGAGRGFGRAFVLPLAAGLQVDVTQHSSVASLMLSVADRLPTGFEVLEEPARPFNRHN